MYLPGVGERNDMVDLEITLVVPLSSIVWGNPGAGDITIIAPLRVSRIAL